jgi:radical SAM superfamily enzyme YgiQ (UPF0313 family)
MPSVGVACIGSYLTKQGISVRIVDSQFRKEDPLPVLRQTPPTLVGISVESRTYARALKIARVAKAHGHTTLLGGLHVSLIREEILDHPEVDYAVVGDGEEPSLQLLQALDGERPLHTVSGLLYRQADGSIGRNPNVTEENDLDQLPVPDYRLAGVRAMNLYPLVTSRDCPFKCNFCTVGQISHGRFRARSAASCVDELEMAKERYGIRGFIVVDENFAYRMDRAKEFCQTLIDRRVNLPWTAFEGVRADCLNEEFLTLLRASGCRWIFFGIETVENAVLKKVEKGGKFEHIRRATEMARRHGFQVGGFLIIGLPGSTYQSDLRAVDWALRTLDKCTFWMAIPYHGTGMYSWVTQQANLLRPPTGPNLINTLSTMPFFETPDYSAGERKRAHTIANLRNGLHYFLDFLDYETRSKLPPHQRTESFQQRRLVEIAQRYDPAYLAQLVPGRTVPPIEDPLAAAVAAQYEGGDEPLPNDLLGNLGTPQVANLADVGP